MAGLTKQHFNKIAEILKDNILKENERIIGFDVYILEQLGFYFQEQNPNFDESRFKEACLK